MFVVGAPSLDRFMYPIKTFVIPWLILIAAVRQGAFRMTTQAESGKFRIINADHAPCEINMAGGSPSSI